MRLGGRHGRLGWVRKISPHKDSIPGSPRPQRILTVVSEKKKWNIPADRGEDLPLNTTDRHYCVIRNVASVFTGTRCRVLCGCATRFKGPTGAYYVLTVNTNMIYRRPWTIQNVVKAITFIAYCNISLMWVYVGPISVRSTKLLCCVNVFSIEEGHGNTAVCLRR